ncbi:MAG TPA: thioredoxin-like domain-containing protein [Drouetiella sp.]
MKLTSYRSLYLLVMMLLLSTAISGCGKTGTSIPTIAVKAPELEGGTDWLNTAKPIKLADLKGKFVLLDFWNLSCVNCFHTIPILKELEHRYANDLVIIGIHSPKYSSEKDTKPLRDAMLRLEIDHPVVNDAENIIWTQYGIRGYPTLVLLDPNGSMITQISGERSYLQLDSLLQKQIAKFKANGQLDEKPLAIAPEPVRANSAPLSFPERLCVDAKRNLLFISDSGHNRIVETDLAGKVLNIIGTGKIGSTDGAFDKAEFHHPGGVAIDGDAVYVADTQNQRIRKIDLKAKTVSTVSGDGQLTDILAPPDLGNAKKARLNSPWDLIVGGKRLYISMAGSHQLYYLDFSTNQMWIYVGSGDEGLHDGALLSADLAQPSGITYANNEIYFTDSESNSVRTAQTDIKNGQVKTITGKGLYDFGDEDGDLATAFLQHPLGLSLLGKSVYVADTLNHKIRIIDPVKKTVKTLWGTGKPGDADGTKPAFNEPNGICIVGSKVYIADTNNNKIKVGDLQSGSVKTLNLSGVQAPN